MTALAILTNREICRRTSFAQLFVDRVAVTCPAGAVLSAGLDELQ